MRLSERKIHKPKIGRVMITAAIISDDEAVRRLLVDTLEEVSVCMTVGKFPDVVIAVVGRTPIESTFALARAYGANTPIVAVLAYADDLVARRARDLGASVTVALSDGLDKLRDAVERAVAVPESALATLN